MLTDVLNAILGYYAIVLCASAVSGVRATRPGAPAAPANSGGRRSPTAAGGPTAGGVLTYAQKFAETTGWAAGVGLVIGALAGRDLYRAGRRGTIATAARIRARRTPPPAPATPPAAATKPTPATATVRPAPAAVAPPPTMAPPAPAPAAAPGGPATTPPTVTGAPAATAPTANITAIPAPAHPGRPQLFLVATPISKDTEPAMAPRDITDIRTLMAWTGQAATIAEMESVDAACVARDAAASVDICTDTAARVAAECEALEHTLTVMTVLGVDGATLAAYEEQLASHREYHRATVLVLEACTQLAAASAHASAAATTVYETAGLSLTTVRTHQLPHLEAAEATGHSGAHASVYGDGIADTRNQHPALTQ